MLQVISRLWVKKYSVKLIPLRLDMHTQSSVTNGSICIKLFIQCVYHCPLTSSSCCLCERKYITTNSLLFSVTTFFCVLFRTHSPVHITSLMMIHQCCIIFCILVLFRIISLQFHFFKYSLSSCLLFLFCYYIHILTFNLLILTFNPEVQVFWAFNHMYCSNHIFSNKRFD